MQDCECRFAHSLSFASLFCHICIKYHFSSRWMREDGMKSLLFVIISLDFASRYTFYFDLENIFSLHFILLKQCFIVVLISCETPWLATWLNLINISSWYLGNQELTLEVVLSQFLKKLSLTALLGSRWTMKRI